MPCEQLEIVSKPDYHVIPVQLSQEEFAQFILPHLSLPKRGPQCKIGYHKSFNYMLKVLSWLGIIWDLKPVPVQAYDRSEQLPVKEMASAA